jgi:hypothetical protein
MNLRYIVAGIGVYIDPEVEKKAKRFVTRAFKQQLEGLDADKGRESDIRQKIYVRHYDSLDLDSFKEARVFPGNSVYDVENDIFVETHMNVGLKLEPDLLTVWVNYSTAIPPPLFFQSLLQQREQVFAHSCAISIDGKGILFPGFGGVGKTAVITKALKDNPEVKILGDDLVICSKDGKLEAYPRPFCIYPYHIPFFEPFMKNENIKIKPLTFKNKVIRKLRTLLDIQSTVAYQFKTISPYKVIGVERVEDKAVPISQVCVLNRYSGIDKLEVVIIENPDTIADYCVSILGYEWNAYYRLFFQLHAHKSESMIDVHNQQREIFSSAFKTAERCLEFKIPMDYTIEQVSTEVLNYLNVV